MAQQSDTVGLPKRIPLATQAANRDDSSAKDAKLVNCYVEKSPDGDYWVYKRQGLSEDTDLSRPSAATGRGMFNWRGSVYTIFNGDLFKNGVDIGNVANSGMYTFSASLGATPTLFIKNTTNAYVWDDATLTAVADPQYPSTTVPGSAYLDATTYVMTEAAAIQGSDLNDPINWDVLNTITAQIEPDAGVAIAKQLVYVVVLKEWTTEVFYDAANPTGSPLGTVQGAKVSYGCVNGASVQSIDDILLWVSTTRSAQAQVIMMQGLKAEVVSTPPIERLIDNVSFTTMYSWLIKDEGHTFYVFTSVEANVTLVFDIRERAWFQWTDSSGNYFPICASSYRTAGQQHLVQHISNGKVYLVDREYYTDAGTGIPVNVYTPNWDAGLDRNKQCTMLRVLADQQTGSTLYVRTNDEDYAADKWTKFRPVDLGMKRPFLANLGTFRRRAHNFYHNSNTPLRLKAIDLQLDLGTL